VQHRKLRRAGQADVQDGGRDRLRRQSDQLAEDVSRTCPGHVRDASQTCARVGLNSDHLTKEFRVLLKKTAEVLSGHYPETMHKTYIINGPLIVRAAWNVSRHMMHPISAAKFSILGSDWKKVFDRDGVVLDGNALPASISWSEAVGELADGGAARRRGWAPPADLANLAALAAVAE